jgi:hypothetical protein
MAEPQKDMSGVLFRNDRRRDGKQDPNLQGSCTIGGRRYWVSAWTHEVQRGQRVGQRYLSLSFTPAEDRDAQVPRRSTAPAASSDDLPF